MCMLPRIVAAALFALTAFMVSAAADERTPSKTPATAQFLSEKDALTFLKSLPRAWKGPLDETDCKTYEDKNIERLGRPFVMLAASFLKAFSETHGTVTINSAHRNSSEQRCVCEHTKLPCAGWRRNRWGFLRKTGGESRHASGRALDVRAGTGTIEEFRCMQEFARRNPVFGISFPLGMRDPPHMEPRGTWGLRAYLRLRAQTMIRAPKIAPCTVVERMYERTWDD